MVRLANKAIAALIVILLMSNVVQAREWENDILLDLSLNANVEKEVAGRQPQSLKVVGKVPQSNYRQIIRHEGMTYLLENVRYPTEVNGMKMFNWKYRVINSKGKQVYATPNADYLDGRLVLHKGKLLIALYSRDKLQLVDVKSKTELATYECRTTRDSMIVFAQSAGTFLYIMVGESRLLDVGKAEDTKLLQYFYKVFHEVKGPEYKFRNLWISGPAYWDGTKFKFTYSYLGRIVYELNCNPTKYEEVDPLATYRYGALEARQVATIIDLAYDDSGTLYMTRYGGSSIYKMENNEIKRYVDIPGTSSVHLLAYDGSFIVYDYGSSTLYEFK